MLTRGLFAVANLLVCTVYDVTF